MCATDQSEVRMESTTDPNLSLPRELDDTYDMISVDLRMNHYYTQCLHSSDRLWKYNTHFDHNQTATQGDYIAHHMIALDEERESMGYVTEGEQHQKVDDGQDQHDDQAGGSDAVDPLLHGRHPAFDGTGGFNFST